MGLRLELEAMEHEATEREVSRRVPGSSTHRTHVSK